MTLEAIVSAEKISAMANQLGLTIREESLAGLAEYAAKLWEWNTKLNLTRHTDVEKFVSRDVADSLSMIPFLEQGSRVLDVGTGGGVPGVILALLRPDLRVELCDSVAKRAKAVSAIVDEIGLGIAVHAMPAQLVVQAHEFDVLVVRAVAPLIKLLTWFEPLADRFEKMLVIKGPRWEEERKEARHYGYSKKVTVRRIAAWPIQGSDNQSVLLDIRRRVIQPPATRE